MKKAPPDHVRRSHGPSPNGPFHCLVGRPYCTGTTSEHALVLPDTQT
jgi:hypothetical protein